VERLGIERSHQALAAADAVLLLFDLEEGWTQADQELQELVPVGVPLLVVGNKLDRLAADGKGLDQGRGLGPAAVAISALTGAGHKELAERLLALCGGSGLEGLEVALNARQRELAAAAAEGLGRSLQAAGEGLPWDFWTIDLRGAVRSLGEITGEEVSEAVLDRVFARFCIGK
jgi:tRNA modification GTPase